MLPANLPASGYSPDRRYYVAINTGNVFENTGSNSRHWTERYQLIGNINKEGTEMTGTTTSTVSKELSKGLIVSSAEFSKLNPLRQTETLASANGKPIVFVKSFNALRDKKKIIERLLKGEDVAMELEFNEIELTADEQNSLGQVLPVLERIRGAKFGAYSWVPITSEEENNFRRNLNFGEKRLTRNGYQLGKPTALRLWNTASAYWAKLDAGEEVAAPRAISGLTGYRRSATFTPTSLNLGCQHCSRAEVEYIAKHYDFEPNVEVN